MGYPMGQENTLVMVFERFNEIEKLSKPKLKNLIFVKEWKSLNNIQS